MDYAAGVLTVEALDARSGRLLWRAQRPVAIQGGGLSLLGVDVQDLTGDGTPEVIVNAYVTNNVDEAFIVTALDGATGAVLFTEQ